MSGRSCRTPGKSNCGISVRPGSVRAGSCAAVEPRRHVQPQLRAEPLGWRLAGRPVPVGTRRANKVAPSGPERDITSLVVCVHVGWVSRVIFYVVWDAETDGRNEANRCMSLRPKQTTHDRQIRNVTLIFPKGFPPSHSRLLPSLSRRAKSSHDSRNNGPPEKSMTDSDQPDTAHTHAHLHSACSGAAGGKRGGLKCTLAG